MLSESTHAANDATCRYPNEIVLRLFVYLNFAGSRSDSDIFQHLSHEGCDRRALRAMQGDMGEERVTLQLLDDSNHTVVPADPQVIPLGDVVGEDNARALPHPAEHGKQHVPLQRLCLVDYNEGIVQRATPDMSERQHLKETACQHLFNDHLRSEST